MSEEEKKALDKSKNLREIDVKLIADRDIGVQVTMLLAYIRHAVQNNLETDIKVKIGSKVSNGTLSFTVNSEEIKDYKTQSEISIN